MTPASPSSSAVTVIRTSRISPGLNVAGVMVKSMSAKTREFMLSLVAASAHKSPVDVSSSSDL